ncbi:MAG: hypothetical protein QGH94_15745 [Phycisphaerae bacterium]|jgi:hypothetical protein|nr:hypothetical protein [Phycisphaerae bacterium]MDP7289438.1 hypothetical protein [Phycisphaerae bacterium]
MSARLSKEDRKRMRGQAEEDIRQAEIYCCVVSPKAAPTILTPQAIIADARKVGVNLHHHPLDNGFHAFSIPEAPDNFRIIAGYRTVDTALLEALKDHEWLLEDRSEIAVGMPVFGFHGKMNLDPAVDFLGMTIKRVLGRLAGGIWIDPGVVMGDWISWSLDYMDPDMFNITRIYDDPAPNFGTLIQRFPQLRCPLPITPARKPWWKFW